jgi:hypothetical protein
MIARSPYLFVHIRAAGAGSAACSVLVRALPRHLLFDRPLCTTTVSIAYSCLSVCRTVGTDLFTARTLLGNATYECLVLAFFFISFAGIEALLGVLSRDADESGDDISVSGETPPAGRSLLWVPLAVSFTGGTIRFWCALEAAMRSGRT